MTTGIFHGGQPGEQISNIGRVGFEQEEDCDFVVFSHTALIAFAWNKWIRFSIIHCINSSILNIKSKLAPPCFTIYMFNITQQRDKTKHILKYITHPWIRNFLENSENTGLDYDVLSWRHSYLKSDWKLLWFRG